MLKPFKGSQKSRLSRIPLHPWRDEIIIGWEWIKMCYTMAKNQLLERLPDQSYRPARVTLRRQMIHKGRIWEIACRDLHHTPPPKYKYPCWPPLSTLPVRSATDPPSFGLSVSRIKLRRFWARLRQYNSFPFPFRPYREDLRGLADAALGTGWRKKWQGCVGCDS